MLSISGATPFAAAYTSITKGKGRTGLDPREWDAFIGIVTAIVGNVLISFALNLQRYAHIRLNRDKLRQQKSWSALSKGKGIGKSIGYGTQEEIAEERAELARNAPPPDEDDPDHRARYHNGMNGASETTPLQGMRRDSISSSGSTIKPAEKSGEDEAQNKSYLKSPYWWAGILLMTCGEAGNFLAYAFAPASIVSPLGVVALISNCIVAPLVLKEPFRQRDFWGVAVAVAGAVTIVFSAKTGETKMGPNDLWDAITRWEFEVYLGLTAGLIVALMWASGKYGDRTLLIDLGLVGLFGGYTALATKGVASLLSDTLWRAITFPVTYLLVFVLVATALLQIRYVNRALQRFDSTEVIPTQFVLFTISVIVGSAVLYRDFESATADRVGKFVGGCALTFLGVWLITSGRNRDSYEDSIPDEDPESGIQMIDEEADQANASAPDGGATGLNLFHQPSDGAGSVPPTPQRLNSNATSILSSPFTPGSTNPNTPSASFPEANPWATSTDRLGSQDPSPLLLPLTRASTNAPPLQSSSSLLLASRPSTPRVSTDAPGTPGALQTPSSSRDRRRPSHLARKSMSHIFPGPIVSPLSSSLSGIVQDTLRRGLDSPKRASRAKRLSGVGRLRSERSGGLEARAADSESLLAVPGTELQEEDGGKKGRSRSLSNTLGSLFKRGRGNSKVGVDEDEGPRGGQ